MHSPYPSTTCTHRLPSSPSATPPLPVPHCTCPLSIPYRTGALRPPDPVASPAIRRWYRTVRFPFLLHALLGFAHRAVPTCVGGWTRTIAGTRHSLPPTIVHCCTRFRSYRTRQDGYTVGECLAVVREVPWGGGPNGTAAYSWASDGHHMAHVYGVLWRVYGVCLQCARCGVYCLHGFSWRRDGSQPLHASCTSPYRPVPFPYRTRTGPGVSAPCTHRTDRRDEQGEPMMFPMVPSRTLPLIRGMRHEPRMFPNRTVPVRTTCACVLCAHRAHTVPGCCRHC